MPNGRTRLFQALTETGVLSWRDGVRLVLHTCELQRIEHFIANMNTVELTIAMDW